MKNLAICGVLSMGVLAGCTSSGDSASAEAATEQSSAQGSTAAVVDTVTSVETAPAVTAEPASGGAPLTAEVVAPTVETTETTPVADPVVTEPVSSTNYYRLRIVYSTTSDWTTFAPINAAHWQSVRLYSLNGAMKRYEANLRNLALVAASGATLPLATPISMVADLAVDKDFATTGGLSFKIGKGTIGAATVKIYGYNNGAYTLISEYTHNQKVGADPANYLTLPIDSNLVMQKAGVQTISHTPIPKKALAFYYPWFHLGTWPAATEFTDKPLQLYSTSSLSDVRLQIDKAMQAGLTGFLSSWWGSTDITDSRFKVLLEAAKDRNFETSIYYEGFRGGKPVPDAQIVSELTYILQSYGSHPKFIRWNGRPVLFLFATTAIPADRWKLILDQVRANAGDAYFIGATCGKNDLDVFDGLHDYAINHIATASLPGYATNCSKQTKNHGMLSDSQKRKIWMGTAMPGFDDRAITSRTTHIYTPRENGEYYKATLSAAINSNPDWMVITSWNEWGENSHIEPSINYGYQYRDLTKQYLGAWLAQ